MIVSFRSLRQAQGGTPRESFLLFSETFPTSFRKPRRARARRLGRVERLGRLEREFSFLQIQRIWRKQLFQAHPSVRQSLLVQVSRQSFNDVAIFLIAVR